MVSNTNSPKHFSNMLSKTLLVLTLLAGIFLIFAPNKVQAATTPKTVMYVEVNDNDFANVAKYSLQGTNRPAFDIGIIFAANINYDEVNKKAYLHMNEQVTKTLENAETQVRPVQARGTKVLLSILGNHQGAGFANFTDYASADAFAKELADVVEKYGLDGIDFDDEYAQYGRNGTTQPNNQSFMWLVEALRKRLGNDKLVTLYNIGPAASNSASNPNLANLVDYAWNPYYGTWSAPRLAGMGPEKLGPGAVEVGRTSRLTARNYTRQTKQGGYGIYLMYNLPNQNSADYISLATQELYGLKTVYKN